MEPSETKPGSYDFPAFERKWQAVWKEQATFRTEPITCGKPKYYVLDMFPYPSGAGLHIGHPEGYTASDILARYKKAGGFNVLHPMGWDAFGLPAEQHAIATGEHPAVQTKRNIDNFRRQLQMLGFAIDWDRELSTTDENYFRWTQWIFLKLFRHGLAYVSEKPVWFCPALGTVLANEEVLNTPEGPRSDRGNHPVERRPIRQWVLRITAYADKLIEGLDHVDWPDSTKRLQKNWIGKSEGAEVTFKLDGHGDTLTVFTTRPDTLFGATYMVIAPEHPLLGKITTPAQQAAVEAYVAAVRNKSDLERTDLADKKKTGVFTGAYAINPVNGAKIPVWTADYVLITYGTGAIMAVPAHDERDWEFAKEFKLPIIQVVGSKEAIDVNEQAWTEDGPMVNSGPFDGLSASETKKRITADLAAKGRELQAARLALLAPALLGRAVPAPLGLPRGLRQDPGRLRGPRVPPQGTRHLPAPWRRGLRGAADLQAAPAHPADRQVLPTLPDRRLPAVEGARVDRGLVRRRLRRHRAPIPAAARTALAQGLARDQHDAPVGRLLLVLPPLHRPEERGGPGLPGRPRILGLPRLLHRRCRARRAAPALRALLAPLPP